MMNKNFDLDNEKKIYSSLPAELEGKQLAEKNRASSNDPVVKVSNARSATRCAANGGELRIRGLDTNFKSDGNDDVFTLHSWNSAANIRPIENDEWQVFLLRNMEVSNH